MNPRRTWDTTFKRNTYSQDMVAGIAVQVMYLLVFCTAAVTSFRRKDIDPDRSVQASGTGAVGAFASDSEPPWPSNTLPAAEAASVANSAAMIAEPWAAVS